MRKIFLWSVIGFFGLSVSTWAAPTRMGQWDAGVNVSAALSGESDIDDTAFIGGNLSYGVTDWIGLGGEVGWHDRDTHDDDLSAVPILFDVLVRVPTPDQPVVPYGIVGLGAIVWDYDRDDFSVTDLDDDVDSSFAVKAGGGVDYFLNEDWIVNGEVSYVFTDEDIEVTGGSRSDLDYWLVGGGLKYLF
jgi:opacity protein-like surface antigen